MKLAYVPGVTIPAKHSANSLAFLVIPHPGCWKHVVLRVEWSGEQWMPESLASYEVFGRPKRSICPSRHPFIHLGFLFLLNERINC